MADVRPRISGHRQRQHGREHQLELTSFFDACSMVNSAGCFPSAAHVGQAGSPPDHSAFSVSDETARQPACLDESLLAGCRLNADAEREENPSACAVSGPWL